MSELSIPLPLEIVLHRKPVSLQGSGSGKQRWQTAISEEIRRTEPAGSYAHEGDLSVTIYYFAPDRENGDIDNIVKPILDAMCRHVYVDDRQVVSLHVHRYEPQRLIAIQDPSATLARAMVGDRPAVYICVDSAEER